MDKAKRARTAETPKQPNLGLQLRAPYLYPDRPYSVPVGRSNEPDLDERHEAVHAAGDAG